MQPLLGESLTLCIDLGSVVVAFGLLAVGLAVGLGFAGKLVSQSIGRLGEAIDRAGKHQELLAERQSHVQADLSKVHTALKVMDARERRFRDGGDDD